MSSCLLQVRYTKMNLKKSSQDSWVVLRTFATTQTIFTSCTLCLHWKLAENLLKIVSNSTWVGKSQLTTKKLKVNIWDDHLKGGSSRKRNDQIIATHLNDEWLIYAIQLTKSLWNNKNEFQKLNFWLTAEGCGVMCDVDGADDALRGATGTRPARSSAPSRRWRVLVALLARRRQSRDCA